MEFLRLLEGIRSPFLNGIMSTVTYVGDEVVFMAIALIMFWCVSKRQGYFIFAVGMLGTIVSQLMKLIFCIPRPWVVDPDFTIVESARAAASGFSFPSGHSQCAVGTLGAIALSNKNKWLRAVCIVFIVLVPFSRMYLGVHTPLDVGVGVAIPVVLLLVFYPFFKNDERCEKSFGRILIFLIAAMAAYLAFVLCHNFPTELYNDPDENLAHGIHNGFTMMGALLGLTTAYIYDNKVLHFDTKAPFIGQVLKLVLGLGLIVLLKAVLKAPLLALCNGSEFAGFLRYYIIVAFGGCVWPYTFPFFAKLGRKKQPE